MTARELLAKLQKLSEKKKDLPVVFVWFDSTDSGSDWEREEAVTRIATTYDQVELS